MGVPGGVIRYEVAFALLIGNWHPGERASDLGDLEEVRRFAEATRFLGMTLRGHRVQVNAA